MFKHFLSVPLLLLATAIFGQSVKPIPTLVVQTKAKQEFLNLSLFNKQIAPAAERPETRKALQNWTLLAWDTPKMQELLSRSGAPISLTLPWENGSIITLDLIPAKNFSAEFQVHTASSGGAAYDADKGVHYWGMVQDDPASLVTLSLFDGEIIGMVEYGNERFTIGALPASQDKTHILFKNSDIKEAPGFVCYTDEELHRIGEETGAAERSSGPDNCVRMYVETDYTLFQNKGSVANVVSYMTGVFSQVSALYTNESINLVLHDLYVWDVVDPYTGPTSSDYLNQFRNAKNGVYNGDLAHLVGINNLGGIAYLDVLCNGYYGVGYSSIYSTYSNVPTYSWTVEVLTHEIGHNLGSPHTHACAWNGNNTAIDGCGPAAGYSEGCNAPLPTNGGTIMSYCHLVNGIGINFNNGFGPQPGDRIRSEVYNASCLAACGGGGECSYVSINSNGFQTGFGIWTDGGEDCVRTNNATYANSPTYSILLRDNTNTSVMSTTNQNWTSYDELTVDFSYYAVSFENGEDFWLQISTNGGSSYTTVGDFNAGTQFSNGVHTSGQVVIAGPFTSNTRLRFRADASADDDRVYIDDVVITGCQQPGFNGGGGDRNYSGLEHAEQAGITNFRAGPNPATDHINIQFDATGNLETTLQLRDLAGRLVLQQVVPAIEGENNISIPMNNLTNGLYLLSVKAGEEAIMLRVVLAK
ncbi:MAG: T9SS type A sorting domain-containing protein [Phycisphaerae bacterium]|nr:T9SS type A sorting domain-containing protein [Saprospiraceae bacterium]